MIALVKQPKRKRSKPAWHDSFEKMLPAIVRHAKFAFRFMPADPREEAVQEVVGHCCTAAYVRLVERGKQEVASPSVVGPFRGCSVPRWPSRRPADESTKRRRCQPGPNAARDSGLSHLSSSMLRTSRGKKSSWRVIGSARRRSPLAGSTSPVGCGCCPGG